MAASPHDDIDSRFSDLICDNFGERPAAGPREPERRIAPPTSLPTDPDIPLSVLDRMDKADAESADQWHAPATARFSSWTLLTKITVLLFLVGISITLLQLGIGGLPLTLRIFGGTACVSGITLAIYQALHNPFHHDDDGAVL
ncbi:MAG: hypothetical protein ACRDAX_03815 [Propionibacteriaceae bacterium]